VGRIEEREKECEAGQDGDIQEMPLKETDRSRGSLGSIWCGGSQTPF
jgi:hypothetical protein